MAGGSSEFAAVPISALPYTDASVPASSGDEFWYGPFTPAASGVLRVMVESTGTGYNTRLDVKYGTPGSLNVFMFMTARGNQPMTFPTFGGTPFYFRVYSQSIGTPAGVTLTLSASAAPANAHPEASIFIPDDSSDTHVPGGVATPWPAAVLSPTTGETLNLVRGFPPGESGDVIPESGILAVADGLLGGVSLYTRDFVFIANNPLNRLTHGIQDIKRYTATSFIVTEGGPSVKATVVNVDGTAGAVYTVTGSNKRGSAPDPTLHILYYVDGTAAAPIKRWDLTNNVALSDLVTLPAGEQVSDAALVVLGDGSVLVGLNGIGIHRVRRYSAAGALLNTYNFAFGGTAVAATSQTLDRIQRHTANGVADDAAFWVWLQGHLSAGDISGFYKVRVSDGALLTSLEPRYQFEAGLGPIGLSPAPTAGHSFSCPLLILSAPTHYGTLIVSKQAPDGPTVDFTIQAGGGLTPASFTLRDGQTRTFTDVPAGDGYSIVEQLPDGWTLESAVVSNGSPLDNIAIAADEVVTVALVNAEEVCECCVATKISIINQALLKLGVSQTIASLDEQSREAFTGNELYDAVLHETLRHWDWPFATKYASAADEVSGYMNLIAGAADDPVVKRPDGSAEWLYAYRYPVDCLKARRIVPTAGRKFDPDPIGFRAGRMWDGENVPIIYSNEADAVLEYTAIVECAQDFFDALFEDALSWRLASKMAPSLSRNGLTVADCWKMYLHTIDTAKSVAAQEQQQEKGGDPDWIRGR